ncbi:MAG: DUF4468 domain-containing protein [Treponema sp.]|jgi:hypothetical protein|nr:DUF4468 domain-containing protein [Treponema sp.]
MKRLIWVLGIVCLCLASCASLGPDVNGPVEYNEVINVNGMSAVDIYTKANMWFVDAFKNADSVIQFSDKQSGTIKGKYVADMTISGYQQYLTTTTITVEARDGRCRISFTDPSFKEYLVNGYGVRMGGFNGGDKPVKAQIMADNLQVEWKSLTSSLQKSLNTVSSEW